MRALHDAEAQAESATRCCGGMAMHAETVRAMARLATALLSALETYGDGGCADCRDRARVLLAQLRRVEVVPEGDGPADEGPGASVRMSA